MLGRKYTHPQFGGNSPGWLASVVVPVGLSLLTGDNGQGAANQASANAANQSATNSSQQTAIALDQWNNYKTTFKPAETALVADAMASGSPAKIMQEGAISGANATQQIGLANAAKKRAQQRMGVNPNSGAALALDQENANSNALAVTGAINQSRKTTQDTSFAKLQDAVGIGKGVATNATAGLSAATAGLASASQSLNGVAANAGNQNAQMGQAFAAIGKDVGTWLNKP